MHWIEQLSGLNNIQVPRCFKPITFRSVTSIELHFADASSFAYGAHSYLRLADDVGNISLSFIASKSRLASVKSVSIPRLKLTAAVLAVRLDEMIRKELDLSITSSFFWTDSTAVLYSIKNTTKHFWVFVANRLASIEREMAKGTGIFLRSECEWPELNTSPELSPEFLEDIGQVKVFNIC